MLTYITMDISLCPLKWYQSAKFGVLAHALYVIRFKIFTLKLKVVIYVPSSKMKSFLRDAYS